MPKHLAMWLAAGGGALLGATATYLTQQPSLAHAYGRLRSAAGRFRCARQSSDAPSTGRSETASGSTGNVAFAAYRNETLSRLDQEERDFRGFLDRLRHAKDREEFESFLAEQRRRGGGPASG